jgi:hypothetical protein
MNLDAILGIVGTVIDRAFPDPVQRDAAKLKMIELQQSGELARLTAETELAKGQMAINQIEAASSDPVVSRWRPGIGWICVAGLAYALLIKPIFSPLILKLFGFALEPVNEFALIGLVSGMLGLGGLRTIEKINGVAAK